MSKQTFESAMKKLELIVGELESGDLPLEKALRKFEEGVRLSTFCSKTLDETERKVHVLLQDRDGNMNEVPFQEEVDGKDGAETQP